MKEVTFEACLPSDDSLNQMFLGISANGLLNSYCLPTSNGRNIKIGTTCEEEK